MTYKPEPRAGAAADDLGRGPCQLLFLLFAGRARGGESDEPGAPYYRQEHDHVLLAGKASYYEVLEAQQQFFPAQNALAQVQLARRLVIVQLYKALGGGWQLEDGQWSSQQSSSK